MLVIACLKYLSGFVNVENGHVFGLGLIENLAHLYTNKL